MYYTALSLYNSACIVQYYHCVILYTTCNILYYYCITLYSMENIAVPTDDMLEAEFYIPDMSDVPVCSR